MTTMMKTMSPLVKNFLGRVLKKLRRKPHFLFKVAILLFCWLLLVAVLVYRDVKNTVCLINPPATAILEDRCGNFLSEGSSERTDTIGYWIVPDPIPQRIEAAFLAIEDTRFYEHFGVDLRAIARAFWHNLTNETRQGASTIPMQVARMQNWSAHWNGDILSAFPSWEGQGMGRRTYWNKLCESLTALLLVRKYGHQAVLRHYLRIVPQGNRIHGAAYAARRYFRKPLQDVSWAEAAVLAALPKAPGVMNLFRPEGREKAVERANLILTLLHQSGTLGENDFFAARQQLASLTIPEKETRPNHSYHAILRIEDIVRGDEMSYTRPIRTTLDSRIQKSVHAIANEFITHYRASGAGNIAVMVVERKSGNVRAYLGSAEYFDADYAGAINYARVPRSSGSTLKPFIYALGLERGVFTPDSLLSDAPIMVELPGGFHQIGNFDDQNLGPLLYRQALATSRNVPAIHVLMRTGIDHAYALFKQLGLASGQRNAEFYGVGMAIGTLYVTLEDLVRAYGVLANDGRSFRLQWIEDERGNLEGFRNLQGFQENEQWIDRDVARLITLFLSDPLARLPVFSRMGALEYTFPAAVKTGTSQGFRDAWTMSYSSKYLVGVWIGHPDHQRMSHVSGQNAAHVAKEIMRFLHPQERRGVAENVFPPPQDYTLVRVCAQTGRRATQDCPDIIPEYFRPGTEPPGQFASSENVFSRDNTGDFGARTSCPPSLCGQDARTPKSPVLGAGGDTVPSPNLVPFTYEQILNASIIIQEPRAGSTFIIDPDTPCSLQTIALKADVQPSVAQIIWHVNGQPYESATHPYAVRWPLTPGTHIIQAHFAHADVRSDTITITVY